MRFKIITSALTTLFSRAQNSTITKGERGLPLLRTWPTSWGPLNYSFGVKSNGGVSFNGFLCISNFKVEC